MKRYCIFLIILGCSYLQSHSQGRIMELFNFGWKFKLNPQENVLSTDYNDADWQTLDLPHDFQIEQPWNSNGNSQRGYKDMGEGWYRKTFNTKDCWEGKRIILDFEGIIYLGDVWVNGKHVGKTDYGYIGFEADITSYLKKGENTVIVRASTGPGKGSRWYTGGGIFRNVNLMVKDSVSIARHGVFITTPQITTEKANVNIQVSIEGLANSKSDMVINTKIYSPNGKLVKESNLKGLEADKRKIREIQLPIIEIENPQLWSCNTPNLYKAEITLYNKNTIIDNVTETFGIRTLEFSPDFGFKLNGEKLFLKGIAVHHDFGAIGAAVFDKAIERQFIQMKKFGFNHVRTSHNPYSKSFMDLADKHGILIVDELIDKWSDNAYWGGREAFTKIWPDLISEWIKRDRNHPSVIMWSLGNELQMREDLIGYQTNDWGITTYRIFDVMVKRYDPTRKTTVAMFPSRAGAITRHDKGFETNTNPPELSLVTDIASYNYQWHVYDDYVKKFPHLIVYQSEASSNELTAPYFGMNYDKTIGLAYWGAIEYWGESRGWPYKGWNFSFFNHALEPYPQAYLIKSAFDEKNPLVHIGVVDGGQENIMWNDIIVGRLNLSSHWNRPNHSTQELFTFTNADEVELFVNGESMGVKKNNRKDVKQRNIIYWKNIPYKTGGIVKAIARNSGKIVAEHKLETTGKAMKIQIEVEEGDWIADGMDLQYVKIYATDKKGRIVPTYHGEIKVNINGMAELVAIDNGDHATDKIFSIGNNINMHKGFAMIILRSQKKSGEVKLEVTSQSLKSASKTLFSK